MPNADLGETRRETIYEELSLPADEEIIAFLDLTDEKEGKEGSPFAGVAYTEKYVFYGFKWHRIGWDAFLDAAISADPNDGDVWIEPSLQIGLETQRASSRCTTSYATSSTHCARCETRSRGDPQLHASGRTPRSI